MFALSSQHALFLRKNKVGTIDEESIGIGKIKKSALLTEKHGRLFFVIKFSAVSLFGASFSHQAFVLDDALKIREFITESQQIAQNLPPLSYDVSKVAIRNMLIVLAIAAALNIVSSDEGFVVFITFIGTVIQANQLMEFRPHPGIDSRTKRYLVLILLFTFGIGVAKFLWLVW